MDEREASRAALERGRRSSAVRRPSARAERRYRRRRNRVQALVAAVVIVLIGSSVAGASVLAGSHDSPATVSPPVDDGAANDESPRCRRRRRPPTKTAPVDPTLINSMSFIDANVGFGIVDVSDATLRARSCEPTMAGALGGESGSSPTVEGVVHFENASDGVAWGDGPLEVTTDGGAHWTTSDPVDNYLAWSNGRLWALTPCVQSTPCGSRPVLISDDTGVTWRQTAPLQLGFGGATVLATSRSTAYIVQPATQTQQPGAWQVAITGDGARRGPTGRCRARGPSRRALPSTVACSCSHASANPRATRRRSRSSRRATTALPGVGAAFIPGESADLANVGATFVANPGRGSLLSSVDDGQSWQVTPLPTAPTRTDIVPGVGIWASANYSGLWFSSDGLHWKPRVLSSGAPNGAHAVH